jgi:transposase-like protein
MTDKMTCRTFPTAFKLAAIKRLMAGEAVLPLARELGVSRKILHDWRKAWDLHGPSGLNRKRGPKPGPRKFRPLAGPAAKDSSGELANARAKIAELERKIGQQAVDIVQRDGVRVDLIDAAPRWLWDGVFRHARSGEKINWSAPRK